MDYIEFKNKFENTLSKYNIDKENVDTEAFYNYMNEILLWNQKINLTAIENEDDFIIKHFIDSLTIIKHINSTDKVLDIGTGAGFPGMCLKMYYKNLNITLIDSINKKLEVIRSIIENKDYNNNIKIIHSRAEDLAFEKECREKFDVVTTRAVSNLSTILEYMLPFVKVGGIAICMKGPNYDEELKNARNAIKILGGELLEIDSIKENELERNNIIIKKIKNTPNNFPRKQGKPLREPIT